MNQEAPPAYSHGISLAPMAGATDSAFRRICRRMGADSTVTEMVAAAGLSRRSVKTCRYLRFHPEEKPLGVQLFGREPGDFSRAAELVSDMGFDFVDINAGCPVKKVVGSGSGSALLREPARLASLVQATVEGTHLPVTVKIRLGWSPEEPVEDGICDLLAGAGATAIAVHGRFRSDMFSGDCRGDGIRRLVTASHVPVVANGDSTGVKAALDLRSQTGAAGLMIGRGAVGNPWLFRGLSSGRPEDALPEPSEYVTVVMEQLEMMKEYIATDHVYHILRGHLMHYVRGFQGAAGLRSRVVRVGSDRDVRDLMEQVAGMVSQERATMR